MALAKDLMDVDTIIPAMLVESGRTALLIGLMTAIMAGGSSLTQLLFVHGLAAKLTTKSTF